MRKVLKLLPNPMLKDYVYKHFDEITLEDFYDIINLIELPLELFKLNNTLNTNSDVLSYMLDINIYSFRYFKRIALNKVCIDKISNSNILIIEEDLINYPELLTNKSLYNKLLNIYPNTVNKLKIGLDTDITYLESINYIPNKDDLNNWKINSSKKLLSNAIKNNSSLLIYIKELDEKLVNLAISNGYIPSKEDFFINPPLKDYPILLDKAFLQDPSIIIFYKRKYLTLDKVSSALNRGYIINKKDIINNPELSYSPIFMEYAIKYNPSFILLIGDTCNINPFIVKEVLNTYNIREEDLINYPNLTRNTTIMHFLPQYKLYNAYLSKEDKINYISIYLNNDFSNNVIELPFFKQKNKLKELFNYLIIDINEEDIEVQKTYYNILNNIIDNIMYYRYIKSKNTFIYPDIVILHKDIIKSFNNIDNIINNILIFTNNKVSKEYIIDNIKRFYNIYLNTNTLSLNDTYIFCNYILNIHKNIFISNGKKILISNILEVLKLSKRKKLNIINSFKLKKITYLISIKDYNTLGISEDIFNNLLIDTKYNILNNKYIKNHNIVIDSIKLDILINKFKELGYIDNTIVSSILDITDSKVIKYIVNSFLKIKYKLINNINIDIDIISNNNINKLNYNNYLILDKNRYINNIAKLLLELDNTNIDSILDNKDILYEIRYLIPLLDIISELDINTYINILINYKRIKDKLNNNISIYNLINLANLYSTYNTIEALVLGSNITNIIGEENINIYVNYYLKMLNRYTSSIPPIYITTNNYILESGVYSDINRLLIGHIPNINSCIKLNNTAGGKTYDEVLLKDTGDVILIRDNNNRLISRILLIRRGNVINMVSNNITSYPYELYKLIANEILRQSIDDNINYVFVNCKSVDNYTNYNLLVNNDFVDKFPHADFCNTVILVGCKDNNININFEDIVIPKYIKSRKKINYSPSEEDITRLRALKLIIDKDKIILDSFDYNEYKTVILGEDWYIALKSDNTLEELVLPSNDPRTYEELEETRNNLLSDSNNRILRI